MAAIIEVIALVTPEPSGVAVVLRVCSLLSHKLSPSLYPSHGCCTTCVARNPRGNGRRRLLRRPYGPTTTSLDAVEPRL